MFQLNFFIFFIIVTAVYWFLDHKKQNIFLLLASYIFYCLWDWRFLFLLLSVTAIDFYCALRISRAAAKAVSKKYLLISLLSDLTLLCFFKYFNFFSDSLQLLLSTAGIYEFPIIGLDIILPLGMSFYIFQSMSYTIDIYRGVTRPTESFIHYSLFLSFFPRIASGPIERASDFIPQIEKRRHIDLESIEKSVYLIIWGLFKKCFVANSLAPYAAYFLGLSNKTPGLDVIIGSYFVIIMIYADFSGYMDIIRGMAGMLGFHLTLNFNLPFFSRNPAQIWRRWHISLCNWVRDYLFFSIGGRRASGLRLFAILMITMSIMGVWHGASWSYLLWGIYHAVALAIYGILKTILKKVRFSGRTNMIWNIGSMILTFHILALGSLIFMAPSLHYIYVCFENLFKNMFMIPGELQNLVSLVYYSGVLIAVECIQFIKKDSFIILRTDPYIKGILCFVILILIITGCVSEGKEFIYVHF